MNGVYGQNIPMCDIKTTATQLYYCVRDCCIDCPYSDEEENKFLGWKTCRDKLMQDAFYWLDVDPKGV